MTNYLISSIIGYAFGCFQASYILIKLFMKADIRKMGNGNAGASNTVQSFGWKFGALVAILDIGKAVISILIVKAIWKNVLIYDELSFLLFLNGFFVILGHNYPFYMGFKGGKGTASLIGMLLAIDNRIGLLCIFTIILVTIFTDYIALGTFALLILFIALTIYFDYSYGCLIIAFLIAAISIYNHKDNISRIMNRKENGLRKALRKETKKDISKIK